MKFQISYLQIFSLKIFEIKASNFQNRNFLKQRALAIYFIWFLKFLFWSYRSSNFETIPHGQEMITALNSVAIVNCIM